MPMTNTTSGSEKMMMKWNSPLLYLFGGLALILGLIALSLITLAFSYVCRKKHRSSDSGDSEAAAGKGSPPATVDTVVPEVARIVVVMAGDDKPTYIAMPAIHVSAASSISSPHPPLVTV